jgi:aldo/keto reductase family protein
MPEAFAYEVPEERALATVRAIFAGPFNFLDTAASYGDGESERRIGTVLREMGGMPAPRSATGSGPAILAARCAHRLHDC